MADTIHDQPAFSERQLQQLRDVVRPIVREEVEEVVEQVIEEKLDPKFVAIQNDLTVLKEGQERMQRTLDEHAVQLAAIKNQPA